MVFIDVFKYIANISGTCGVIGKSIYNFAFSGEGSAKYNLHLNIISLVSKEVL